MESDSIIFFEAQTAASGIYFKGGRVLYHERSDYQDILIFENPVWGRILFLDGLLMLTEKDEFFYHEALVHPLLTSLDDIREILVIGGGDGGTVREILRYREVERVLLVEIDEKVINASRKYLPFTARAFEDPKVEILIDDGAEFVKKCNERFNAIIIDSSEPVGPSASLFSDGFFSAAAGLLEEGGGLALQAGSPFLSPENYRDIFEKLKRHFKEVLPYTGSVPTYPSGIWGYFLAFTGERAGKKRALPGGLRYVDNSFLQLNVPPFIQQLLSQI